MSIILYLLTKSSPPCISSFYQPGLLGPATVQAPPAFPDHGVQSFDEIDARDGWSTMFLCETSPVTMHESMLEVCGSLACRDGRRVVFPVHLSSAAKLQRSYALITIHCGALRRRDSLSAHSLPSAAAWQGRGSEVEGGEKEAHAADDMNAVELGCSSDQCIRSLTSLLCAH